MPGGVPNEAAPLSTLAPTGPPALAAASPHGGLDLCYVTPRIIVCGRPSMRGTDVRDHRNNTAALAAWLDQKHGGDYLVVNLSNKNRNNIDYGRLGNSVLDFQPFSPPWIVDDAPAFSQTWRIIYSLHFWLAWGSDNVAVLHCNTGVFRSGFIVAAFLMYEGLVGSMEEGLAKFAAARGEAANAPVLLTPWGDTHPEPPLSFAARMYPSWRYLGGAFDASARAPAAVPKAWLCPFLIFALPGLTNATSSEAMPIVQLLEGAKLLFDSSIATEGVHTHWEGDKLIVELSQPLVLCGDYQVWVTTPTLTLGGGGGGASRLTNTHLASSIELNGPPLTDDDAISGASGASGRARAAASALVASGTSVPGRITLNATRCTLHPAPIHPPAPLPMLQSRQLLRRMGEAMGACSRGRLPQARGTSMFPWVALYSAVHALLPAAVVGGASYCAPSFTPRSCKRVCCR